MLQPGFHWLLTLRSGVREEGLGSEEELQGEGKEAVPW